MNINPSKSNWKILLAIIGVAILLVTLYYSNYLATELEKKELLEAEVFALTIESISKQTDLNMDMPVQSKILEKESGIPIIMEDEKGNLAGNFWGEDRDTSIAFLEKKKAEFLKNGKEPLLGSGYSSKIYFFNSPLLKWIKLFPLAQICLVGLFIGLGYFLFSSAKSSEQNRVWAGMAKETAHQLGTPISAIIAWIEHLKLTTEDNPEQDEIILELRKDVKRLELIADRFSKIGSTPELERVNIYLELDGCKDYMVRRSPKRVVFDFPKLYSDPIYVNINRHLFDWVMENLIRNALDAMDREGQISAVIYQEQNYVCIDLTDTGSGIPE